LGITNALTVTALSLEWVSYFGSRALAADPVGLQQHIEQRAIDAQLLSLTALWSVYGFILAAVGLWRRWAPVRWAGLALLGLTILKLITIDTMAVELAQMGFPPVLNFQFVTCLLVVVVLSVLAWRFRRQAHDLIGYESYVFAALVAATNEGDVFLVPDVGMPTLSPDPAPQFGAVQTPVAQHYYRHLLGHCWRQGTQQFHYRVHPGPRPFGPKNAPRHRNGASPVNHADHDSRSVVPFHRGVNGQSQSVAAPPGQHPFQQGRKAEAHVQFRPTGTRPVAPVPCQAPDRGM